MNHFKIGKQETRFAELIWDNAPISSPDLVKLAAEHMHWSKSTTYTILRRLCERQIFKNENAIVTVLISRDAFNTGRSRKFVEDTFGGSMPKFIMSFIGGDKLTSKQADELIYLINEYKEGHKSDSCD